MWGIVVLSLAALSVTLAAITSAIALRMRRQEPAMLIFAAAGALFVAAVSVEILSYATASLLGPLTSGDWVWDLQPVCRVLATLLLGAFSVVAAAGTLLARTAPARDQVAGCGSGAAGVTCRARRRSTST